MQTSKPKEEKESEALKLTEEDQQEEKRRREVIA